jgi:hypothetical protein
MLAVQDIDFDLFRKSMGSSSPKVGLCVVFLLFFPSSDATLPEELSSSGSWEYFRTSK